MIEFALHKKECFIFAGPNEFFFEADICARYADVVLLNSNFQCQTGDTHIFRFL
jgi:hypothetical protein